MTSHSSLSHVEIQALLTNSAYDPAIVSKLEAYVRAQVSAVASTLVASECPNVQYSFDANRTLVKLYQFFPHLEGEMGSTIISMVAFLALLQFPETDFMALSYLIPHRVQSIEPCATLVRCAELLEACQFSEFWPEFRKLGIPEYGAQQGESHVSEDRKLLADAVNGSSASNQIRVNMIRILAKTYHTAPLSSILSALDLIDEVSLMSFSSKVMVELNEAKDSENETCIVQKVENDFVVFTSSPENTKKIGSAYKEGVNYASVAAIMSKTKIQSQ